jgi:hypothetical protein
LQECSRSNQHAQRHPALALEKLKEHGCAERLTAPEYAADCGRKLCGNIADVLPKMCIPHSNGVAVIRIFRLRYELNWLASCKSWALQRVLAMTGAGHVEHDGARHKF